MKKKLLFKTLAVIISLSFIIGTVPCVFAVDSLRLTATFGDTLNEVTLPEGYSWNTENPESVKVGNVGTNSFDVLHNVDGVNTEKTAVVTVSPAYISEVSLQTDGSQYYTGDPGEPDVKLFFKGKELIKDTDYTIIFESIDSGIAKVTVEGIGNFQGKTSLSVNIEKQDTESVSINKAELALKPGESEQLTATVSPANATFKDVIWSSSDEDVAVVDEKGNVQAIGNGEATITAETKDGGFTAECKITVYTDVEGITIPVSKVKLIYKETYQLKTIIIPFNASNSTVIWSSSDENVATVDKNGLIRATGRGNAVITATTADGKFSDTCEVTVRYTWWQAILWLFLGCLWYFK